MQGIYIKLHKLLWLMCNTCQCRIKYCRCVGECYVYVSIHMFELTFTGWCIIVMYVKLSISNWSSCMTSYFSLQSTSFFEFTVNFLLLPCVLQPYAGSNLYKTCIHIYIAEIIANTE